ncbi:MAG: phosphate/phosphite/phosphonate ABC transporter substrate-binding protein [Pyrobaculum sp.]
MVQTKVAKVLVAVLIIVVILAIALAIWPGGDKIEASKIVEDKIVVVVNPGVSTRVTVAEAEELRQFLERELGMRVEIYYPLSTAAVVESLKFKHAHVALGVGSLVGAIAMREAEVEMPLVEIREVVIDKPTAAPYYYSYFIVLKESPYRTLDELKGRRACFPSETSVSGFIMPMKLLLDRGYIDTTGVTKPSELPLKFFGEVKFGGGYAQCWEALKGGHVDVTVMAGDVALKLYYDAMNNSRVLLLHTGEEAKAGPNPSHVVLVRKDLPPEIKQKIVEALLKLNDRPELMRKYVSAIFVRFEKRDPGEHLGPLMAALESLGLARYLK